MSHSSYPLVRNRSVVRDVFRIVDIDALRAVALLLILLVNIAFFSSGYDFHLVDDPTHDSVDLLIAGAVELLFAMKAYLLFAFLFGYSFTLQLDSAARRGVAFRPAFLRRLTGLFVLGVLHAVLLFHGDILTTYALLGLACCSRSGGSAPHRAVASGPLGGIASWSGSPPPSAPHGYGPGRARGRRRRVRRVALQGRRPRRCRPGAPAVDAGDDRRRSAQGPLAFAAFFSCGRPAPATHRPRRDRPCCAGATGGVSDRSGRRRRVRSVGGLAPT